MQLRDVWDAATYLRDADETIVAVELPIAHWRFLLDHVQELQDRLAVRERLARLHSHESDPGTSPAPDGSIGIGDG